MHFEVGIGPQKLPCEFQNEIMDHSCSDRGLISNKTDVPNFVKDVPNFGKDVPKFQSAFQGGDRPPITLLWVSK